jgi:hypothetical protein
MPDGGPHLREEVVRSALPDDGQELHHRVIRGEGFGERGRGELAEQFAGFILDEAGFEVEAGQCFCGEQGGRAELLDDAADFQHGFDGQGTGGHQLFGFEVPDHGAVGADDGAGVAQLVLQRVQPARRPAGDKNEFDAGVAAGVEGADGAVTDFSIVSKDRSVNIARYQPHHASLRGCPC